MSYSLNFSSKLFHVEKGAISCNNPCDRKKILMETPRIIGCFGDNSNTMIPLAKGLKNIFGLQTRVQILGAGNESLGLDRLAVIKEGMTEEDAKKMHVPGNIFDVQGDVRRRFLLTNYDDLQILDTSHGFDAIKTKEELVEAINMRMDFLEAKVKQVTNPKTRPQDKIKNLIVSHPFAGVPFELIQQTGIESDLSRIMGEIKNLLEVFEEAFSHFDIEFDVISGIHPEEIVKNILTRIEELYNPVETAVRA